MSMTYDVFEYVCQNPTCTKAEVFANVPNADRSVPVVEMQWGFCRKCLECLQRFNRFKVDEYYQPLKTRTKWESDKPSKQTLLVTAYFGSPGISLSDYQTLVAGLRSSPNVVRQVYKDCCTISTILTNLDVLE